MLQYVTNLVLCLEYNIYVLWRYAKVLLYSSVELLFQLDVPLSAIYIYKVFMLMCFSLVDKSPTFL